MNHIRLSRLWFLLLILAGCATTRYIASPSSRPADVELQTTTEEIEVKIHHVITPDGPGSWVKGAKWTEWVVSITNRAQSDLAIARMSLLDPGGVYVDPGRAGPWDLYSTAGSEMAQGVARSSATTMALGTAGMMTALVCPFCPILTGTAITGIPIMDVYSEAKDQELIQAEFEKRHLPSPLRLGPGGSVRGSVFFPLISAPQALVVTYSGSGGEKQVKIILEKNPSAAQVQSEKQESKQIYLNPSQ